MQSVETPGARASREQLKKLAWLLDSAIGIPGTRFTVGLDALIGLIPVLGDLIGVALSTQRASRWFGALFVATTVLFAGLSICTGFIVLRWVVSLF